MKCSASCLTILAAVALVRKLFEAPHLPHLPQKSNANILGSPFATAWRRSDKWSQALLSKLVFVLSSSSMSLIDHDRSNFTGQNNRSQKKNSTIAQSSSKCKRRTLALQDQWCLLLLFVAFCGSTALAVFPYLTSPWISLNHDSSVNLSNRLKSLPTLIRPILCRQSIEPDAVDWKSQPQQPGHFIPPPGRVKLCSCQWLVDWTVESLELPRSTGQFGICCCYIWYHLTRYSAMLGSTNGPILAGKHWSNFSCVITFDLTVPLQETNGW